ncbi:hypothetical protein TVAG_390070 [Trichomonas vaginalis G3]|uniref:P/Homo B domain-containing protein n=1 Tax=Trichomonas vaginalis (strain ATCC PRA-98 / G3) TaxID=412133 RepID=A2E1A9_TRIV3|nr:galactose-binding domain-like family [Trichomonas vaginalis G3]EAY13610.1 hypothetical protein TVAG_390070 [Trichomonas vaginalis G3]KAI5489990.1 galactose-binding domain-like family [Trichomonas vaginalis G3]|eukprot:XP_001325833.1 hypothetical protein [Trichomonas vaginalis G3]
MSSTWSNNVLPTHRIILSRKVNINQTIPFARTGKIELTFSFNITDPDCFVENVIFKFNVSNHDISRLRIYLESPSGTKIELMKPSKLFRTTFIKSDFYASEPLHLLSRCFFGEKVGCDWKVTIVDGSFYTNNHITSAVLTIEYMAECESLPRMNEHEGHHSAFEYTSKVDNIKLQMNQTELECGVEYPFSMNDVGHKNIVYMSLVDPETNYTHTLEYTPNKPNYNLRIPCYYEGTREFYISARSFTLEQVSSVRVRITNKNSVSGFTIPSAYENFNSNPATPTFKSVTVVDNRRKFVQAGISDYYLISWYDLDTNTIEYSRAVYSIDKTTIQFVPGIKKTVHAVLTMVPSNAEDDDPCSTYIIPILISNDTPQDSKFAVPLNDFCPIPNGVITKLPITPTPSSKNFFKTAGGISVIIVIIIVPVSISIGIFFFYRSRKMPKVRSALSDQLLL